MEPFSNTKESSEHSIDFGEVSIFIKTTVFRREEIAKLISSMRKYLLTQLQLDMALIETEDNTRAQKNGTLKTLKFYFRVFKASDSDES